MAQFDRIYRTDLPAIAAIHAVDLRGALLGKTDPSTGIAFVAFRGPEILDE
jgi:hypothetical protein